MFRVLGKSFSRIFSAPPLLLLGLWLLAVGGCAVREEREQGKPAVAGPVPPAVAGAMPSPAPGTPPMSPRAIPTPSPTASSAQKVRSVEPAPSTRATNLPTSQTSVRAEAPAPFVLEKPGAAPREISLYEEAIILSKVRANLKSLEGWSPKDAAKVTFRRGTVFLPAPDGKSSKQIRVAAETALRVPQVRQVQVLCDR